MQTKSEMINRIAELAEENAKLNAIIDSYQPKIQALKDENYGLNQELLGYKKGVQAAEIIELKAENEWLKKELRAATMKRLTMFETLDIVEENTKYKQALQEIKEIADAKCNECKYGKDGISCKYGDCGEAKLHLIVQLINKAESEG